jgi:drug/metabolite transporter (DMT)-like permease
MVAATAAFATMGALTHGLRDQFGWEIIALARSVVILSLIGTLAAAGGVRLRVLGPPALWVRSIAGTLSMLCVFYSFTRLPVGIVVTLLNLSPAWVAILSWPLLKRPAGKGVWLAIGIGLAGVALIQRPELAAGNLAVLAPLAASLALAFVMLALHRLRHVEKRATVFHFAAVSLVGCLAAVLVSGWTTTFRWTTEPLACVMLIGVGVSATVGQLALTAAFALGPPARVSVVGLSQVGFAMAYDVALWGHQYDAWSLLGIVLVVAPTAWLLVWERRVLNQEVAGT